MPECEHQDGVGDDQRCLSVGQDGSGNTGVSTAGETGMEWKLGSVSVNIEAGTKHPD